MNRHHTPPRGDKALQDATKRYKTLQNGTNLYDAGGPRLAVWLSPLLATATLAISLHAQFLVRPVNLAELTQRAAIIVQGRVLEARYEGHPDYPNLPTVRVTLEVERMLRGAPAQRFSFREFLPPLHAKPGKRGYLVGQRLLLFLPLPSRYGLSSPLGREQGRFRISRDRQGNDLIANDLGNAGLFKHVAAQAAQAGLTLSAEQARLTAVRRGPVPLARFLSLLQRLTSLPRIQ